MFFCFLPRLVPQLPGGHYSRPQYLQELCKIQVYLIAFLHLYVPHTVCQLRVRPWIIGAAEGSFQCLQVTTAVWNSWRDTKTVGFFYDVWSLTCPPWVSHHPCLLCGSHWRSSSSHQTFCPWDTWEHSSTLLSNHNKVTELAREALHHRDQAAESSHALRAGAKGSLPTITVQDHWLSPKELLFYTALS